MTPSIVQRPVDDPFPLGMGQEDLLTIRLDEDRSFRDCVRPLCWI